MGIWRHLRAIALLPGMVALVIPGAIVYSTRTVNLGGGLSSPLNLLPPLFGSTLVGIGLFLMAKTISLFAMVGRGTLAPWDPTQRLVVQGVYRYVRNPMISGVLCVLLGEAISLGSLPLLYWFLLVWALNAVYIPLVEERQLAQRFGQDYLLYKQNVPRWIPRRRPWFPP